MKVFYNNIPFEKLIESNIDAKTYSYIKCIQEAVRHIEYDDEGSGINVEDEGSKKMQTIFMYPMSKKIQTLAFEAMNARNCLE